MSTLLVAVVMLAAQPGEPGYQSPSGAAAAEQPAELRTGTKLRDAAREALRRWAKPGDDDAQPAAREFLGLYKELQQDTQVPKSQREELRSKVRSRLGNLAQQIAKQAVEKRLQQRDLPKALQDAGVLAQWGGMGPGGFGGMMPGMRPGMMPGPMAGMGAGGAAGAAVADDYGQQLVELIQATIAPHTWDTNGGPGSIYYWRPGRALVIRASDDVHEDIGGVIGQLQRAGQ
jgi:hypothetical protein